MATTKNGSYSLSDIAHAFIEAGAENDRLSKSAWVEKAVIYYAIATGAPAETDEAFAEALADEHEAAAADDEFRERGAA
ncbi:hypothetical protein [Nonomuraea diastatica]|uniref:Uncharacterized protein n=1 Tax=Nonomuraea diastatica TaxID=1848329 RepID=A0A4R4WCN8_9ACTN|nr:hypothetical protein [Nonomuraea diastatica]TDD16619.1 hypothetical protein E1294_30780 [Nonomuraea diastatica]